MTLGLASARRSEPVLEKIDLFEAGKAGYRLYHIPGVVVTAKGSVLAWCDAEKRRRLGRNRYPPAALDRRRQNLERTQKDCRRSRPENEEPGRPEAEIRQARRRDLQQSRVHRRQGRRRPRSFLPGIHALLLHRSDDDGQTFSKPVEITSAFEKFRKHYEWKACATGPIMPLN